jgi:hypothetical protein
LDLSNNQIRLLPAGLRFLNRLQRFQIQGNPIENLENLLRLLGDVPTLEFDPNLFPPLARSYINKKQKIDDLIIAYSRPMGNMMQQIIEGGSLTEYEEDRFLYSITFEERQWLESKLPPTHPFLQKMMVHYKVPAKDGKFILL